MRFPLLAQGKVYFQKISVRTLLQLIMMASNVDRLQGPLLWVLITWVLFFNMSKLPNAFV